MAHNYLKKVKINPAIKTIAYNLRFEIISLIGRFLLGNKIKLSADKVNFLNIGCGDFKFAGWVNADFFPGLVFWRTFKGRPEWMLDLRYKLKCADNMWDGVFMEHVLEHLIPEHAIKLLKEIHRTMKPGAWLRITVPDLEKYVEYYVGKNNNCEFMKWETGCQAIRSITQNYMHLSVWDQYYLRKILIDTGYMNVNTVDFREGTDERLLKEMEHRRWETLYMEAQKAIS